MPAERKYSQNPKILNWVKRLNLNPHFSFLVNLVKLLFSSLCYLILSYLLLSTQLEEAEINRSQMFWPSSTTAALNKHNNWNESCQDFMTYPWRYPNPNNQHSFLIYLLFTSFPRVSLGFKHLFRFLSQQTTAIELINTLKVSAKAAWKVKGSSIDQVWLDHSSQSADE